MVELHLDSSPLAVFSDEPDIVSHADDALTFTM